MNLIKWFLGLFKSKKPKDYPILTMKWVDLKTNLGNWGLELMLKDKFVPDATISYTYEKVWATIIPYLTYPADLYIAELDVDCDDYSKWASANSSKDFRLSGCLQCWGDTPLGFHAFNLVITGDNTFKLFESNAGFEFAGKLFNAGDNGYLPSSWK